MANGNKETKKVENKNFKMRAIMNVQHNIIEVMEERRLKLFGHLRRMESDIISKKSYWSGMPRARNERKAKTLVIE